MHQTELTQGPWIWTKDANGGMELQPGGDLIGEGVDSILCHGADWPMKEADKRAIQKVPELVALLKRMAADYDYNRSTEARVESYISAKILIAAIENRKPYLQPWEKKLAVSMGVMK